ncbi:hypothetical protein Taro_052680 [Colocasia esculenta]|uniref:Uncharacterized protein n=1 Tax=Colocasia esculenta TaxID=4460 RepID=A0A843XKD4_COLES|nr:hypothetical protein [Colocasia esculenta]
MTPVHHDGDGANNNVDAEGNNIMAHGTGSHVVLKKRTVRCQNQKASHPDNVTPAVLTPSASRPTNNSVGLVSYLGDAGCVDIISFKTHEELHWSSFTFR